MIYYLFFFNDTATTEIYTFPYTTLFRSHWSGISIGEISMGQEVGVTPLQLVTAYSAVANGGVLYQPRDRKSTRLNSSHSQISYAVFCLKKKKVMTKCGQRVACQSSSIAA